MEAEPVALAVLAKAPVPGKAKTRLICELGMHGAAWLHERMIERTVTTACAAALGPVTLWATEPLHACFAELARSFPILLQRQGEGDLGARMLAPIARAAGPTLVIGTDCPALTPDHLKEAAAALDAAEVVIIPADDGGYVLIGMRVAHAGAFEKVNWGSGMVLEETRRNLVSAGLSWRELPALWDVDTPFDLLRLTALTGWRL